MSPTPRTLLFHHPNSIPMPISWNPPLMILKKRPATIKTLLFLLFLSTAAFISAIFNSSCLKFLHSRCSIKRLTEKTLIFPQIETTEFKLNCTTKINQNQTCPTNYPRTVFESENRNSSVCPNYFRWIYEDLRPWRVTGISRDMVERAKETAHFRLVIVKGKVYVEKFRKSIQTRDVFTIWGILQVLRRYPGRLPDLELMFDCDDRPVIKSKDYGVVVGPPPLFRYCGDRRTLDIVFPDWSFWGWAEINIKPWDDLLKDIKEGNNITTWIDREPYAYWKGNPFVGVDTRHQLLACNVSDKQDWNARLFIQDWNNENKQGFKQSNLARQCTYRYKIYIEGYAWSVSEKYILACNSMALLVKPYYHDFFTRSLKPLHHYWPIQDTDKCRSVNFAVDWGNKHIQQAQEIGNAASNFMQEELKMENVYDYMFHLLNEYAKLLKFEPEIPEGAMELCSEIMGCSAEGLERKFMEESLVKSPKVTGPCSIPPAYEPKELEAFYRKNLNKIRKVQKWEADYYSHHSNM
ncbi:uncharacterized protein [Euphorbia lathyris]|uniref:uncharacterized protein isoform X1 n=2 Tax=Euphorbia lathyris TaxID=212925 RepID=UPI0033139352